MRSYFYLAVLITWCRTAFSQPLIHGVPKVASSEISRNFTKIWEAISVNSFLFLEADHFCHNLFLKRCSISWPSVLAQKTAKYEKLFFRFVSLILRSNRWFYNLFLKRCSKASICGHNPNQTKNRRSYFCLAVLITWCRTAFSQPLFIRVFTH